MFLRRSLSGTVDSIRKSNNCSIVKSSLTGSSSVISTSKKVNESIPLQWSLSFKNYIHSGNAKEFEAGRNSRNPEIGRSAVDRGFERGRTTVDPNMNNIQNPRSNFGRSFDANAGRSFMGANGFNPPEGYSFPRVNIEKDGDIVHMKLLRNNVFVTVTDSNGNKKFGSTTGRATKGAGKIPRYSAEAVAEQIGHEAKERGIKSVVIKVNGCTYFTRKKRAVLSFREGYSQSRSDKNPVVYVEDTTRLPHNGCRRRKQRRF